MVFVIMRAVEYSRCCFADFGLRRRRCATVAPSRASRLSTTTTPRHDVREGALFSHAAQKDARHYWLQLYAAVRFFVRASSTLFRFTWRLTELILGISLRRRHNLPTDAISPCPARRRRDIGRKQMHFVTSSRRMRGDAADIIDIYRHARAHCRHAE